MLVWPKFEISLVWCRFGGSSPAVDKPRNSLPWSLYQKQSFESSMPWCRLLSQSGQVSLCEGPGDQV